MTTTLSDDALSAQQSRIMNAMRAQAQPSDQQVSPQDLLQAITANNSGQGNYFDMLKQAQTTQATNNVNAETGVYAQMKEQVARGNTDAAAVDKAITDVAGDDPKIYANIAQQLHADPEKVTPANAKSKVMKYAAEQGINPLSNQTAQANTQKTQMEIVGNFVGNTTDQNSYDRAKTALQKTGVNTDFLPDKFDPNYVNKMKFIGATPSAQLSAIMQQQQMALRGKIAGLDDSSGASLSASPASSLPEELPQTNQTILPKIMNNTPGQTPAEKAASMIDDNALPAQPVKQPNETTKNYTARLQAWKSNPDIVAHLSEEGASGKDTIKYNNSITADAKQAINMHNTIATMQQAQQQFQAGAFAPATGTLVKYARALGVPVSDKQIATLSNQQVFNKLQNDIIGQAAKAEGGASRLQSAFDAIKSSNPNIGMEPESLNTLFKIMDTKAGEVTDEQQAWNTAKKANPGLSGAEFERNYIAQRAAAQENAGGKLPGYKGNPNTPQNNVGKVVKFSDLPKG